MNNFAELGGSESVDRKARLADQGNVFQRSSRFDLVQGDRAAKRFDWRQIDRTPIAFFSSGIGIGGANDFGNPDDRFVGDAVIKQNFITHAHAAEIISRGEIAHAGPTGLALGNEIIPGIGGRFRFHEPMVFHFLILVIPSEAEGSRYESFKVAHRDPSASLGMTIKAWAVGRQAWLGAANLATVRQVWLARLAWEEQRLPRRPGDLRQREQPADRLRRMIRDGWRVPCAKRRSV